MPLTITAAYTFQTTPAAAIPFRRAVRKEADCLDFGKDANNSTDDSSWSGGIPPAGAANGNWIHRIHGHVQRLHRQCALNWRAAAAASFVSGATGGTADQQIQIIRQPLTGESASSPLGASREFNKANIHILLADTQAELHPDGSALDAVNDIDLTNGGAPTAFAVTGAPGGTTGTAWADPAKDGNWVRARNQSGLLAAAAPGRFTVAGCGWSTGMQLARGLASLRSGCNWGGPGHCCLRLPLWSETRSTLRPSSFCRN